MVEGSTVSRHRSRRVHEGKYFSGCRPANTTTRPSVLREEEFTSSCAIVTRLLPGALPETVGILRGDESSTMLDVGAVADFRVWPCDRTPTRTPACRAGAPSGCPAPPHRRESHGHCARAVPVFSGCTPRRARLLPGHTVPRRVQIHNPRRGQQWPRRCAQVLIQPACPPAAPRLPTPGA